MTKIKKKDDREQRQDVGKKSKSKNKFIAIGIVAVAIVAIVFVSYKQDNTANIGFPAVDGIACETVEHFTFHVHAHLDIFVDGLPFSVPASIGIKENTCLYWLHTHRNDGIIHIESPQKHDFTLSQFFDIWKHTGQLMPSANQEPIIYVNGNLVTTKLRDIPLNAHDEIVLLYGNPPPNIPRSYEFAEGL